MALALGPQGFLINLARGTVVDEAALIKALQEKAIAGAGLDVYVDEPHVPEALFALDNVVLLPHVASATHETRQAMASRVLENLRAFFAEGKPKVAAPVVRGAAGVCPADSIDAMNSRPLWSKPDDQA